MNLELRDLHQPNRVYFFLCCVPERKRDDKLYEHPFSPGSENRELIRDMEGIKSLISPEFVREEFMNVSFCEFVFDFAGFASSKKVMKSCSNCKLVFQLNISPSHLAMESILSAFANHRKMPPLNGR